MAYTDHVAYTLATTDVQRAIYLVMIMAQKGGGRLPVRDFVDYCRRTKIGKSAVRTATRFYTLFREDPLWKFPAVVTDENIFSSYAHYKKGEIIKFHESLYLKQEKGTFVVSLSQVIDALKDNLAEAEKERTEYYRLWEDALEERNAFQATASDLRNRLSKTERLIESLQRSFSDIVKGMLSDNSDEDERGGPGSAAV